MGERIRQNIKGKVKEKDGKLMMDVVPQICPLTGLMEETSIEIEVDEIFEDFSGRDVEIVISDRSCELWVVHPALLGCYIEI